MKRVSIIIANYNYGQYLAESIRSALGQTWPHTEVIVIDDGSTDNSLEIARRFDITVLAQKNLGVSSARNNAVQAAKGDYVLFLDADDILYPEAVEKLHAGLSAADDSAAYAYGQMDYFGYKQGLFASSPFDTKKLARTNFICVTCLMRKDVFLKVGGFDRTMKSREDWEMFVRLLHHGFRGVFVNRPIMRCRKHRPPARRSAEQKRQKTQVAALLFWRYPRFFAPLFFKKPIRHLLALVFSPAVRKPGLFGPLGNPKIIRVAGHAAE